MPLSSIARQPGVTQTAMAGSARTDDDQPAAFGAGLRGGAKSVFAYVMFGTFLGYGALCHGLDFSLPWALLSTVLVWAGPAQLIVVTALASGTSAIEGGDCGDAERHAAAADGGGAAAVDPHAVDAVLANAAAGAFHRGQHLGRGLSASRRAFRANGGSRSTTGWARMLTIVALVATATGLPAGGAAAAGAGGGGAVSHADVVSGRRSTATGKC